MRKLLSGFPTRSDTNRAGQLQKMVRGLKFRIKEEEGLYYLCHSSENKGSLISQMQKAAFLMTRLIYLTGE